MLQFLMFHEFNDHTASTTVVVHHKAHTASKGKISVHQVVVDPQAHGIPLLNATAIKKEIDGSQIALS